MRKDRRGPLPAAQRGEVRETKNPYSSGQYPNTGDIENQNEGEMRGRYRPRICSKMARFFRSRSSPGESATALRQAAAARSASPR